MFLPIPGLLKSSGNGGWNKWLVMIQGQKERGSETGKKEFEQEDPVVRPKIPNYLINMSAIKHFYT